MIRIETREHVRALVEKHPEGITLTKLHNQVYRMITRLQLRTVLGVLYAKSRISRERVHELNRRETKYYPFNGKPPVKRARKPVKVSDTKMLDMKDFMPGKKYQAYLDF
ncbi:MAG TPA: hypothetical protein VK808_07025 [Bacteroidia bacterium]|jgi:hypothetical protein|nr:hypothetical protein [Bacteroidia bacterium]